MSQVADYNIANASGASVRSDLNAVFDAIKTCNSGGTDPANPEAFMLYVDTADSNRLKIRNAANNAFVTIGSVNEANLGLMPKDGSTAMTGAFKLADGNEVSPSLSFNSDTDSGFYKNGANQIGVTTGGTKRFTVGSYGIELRNGAQFEFRKNDNSFFTAFSASDSISENRLYTLPPAVVAGGFLQTDGSGNLSFQIIAGVPSGSVFCMAVATVPSGYFECNGQAISRTTYSALFAVIGTSYGAGNGSSTFNVPDLRGEFIRGFDNGRGVDSGRSVATFQGGDNASHNHTASSSSSSSVSDPGHQHSTSITGANVFPANGGVTISFGGAGSYPATTFTMNNATTGISVSTSTSTSVNNSGSEARPRNISMMYIIKV